MFNKDQNTQLKKLLEKWFIENLRPMNITELKSLAEKFNVSLEKLKKFQNEFLSNKKEEN